MKLKKVLASHVGSWSKEAADGHRQANRAGGPWRTTAGRTQRSSDKPPGQGLKKGKLKTVTSSAEGAEAGDSLGPGPAPRLRSL